MKSPSSIQQFIETRCHELDITFKQLIINSGYSNTTVGLKRLNQLFDADFQSARGLIEQLPKVLDIDSTVLEQVIADTKAQLKADVEQKYRANFKPNLIIRTANRGRPKQIFVAAMLNASQYITREFPAHLNVNQYIRYAVEFFDKSKIDIQSFYFAPEDIVINYSPDCAEVVSLQGEHIEQLGHSIKNGSLTIQFR